MFPIHTIAPNSNFIWLTGGVARALRAAHNAPTRVALTARNGLPSASIQLIPWPQLVRSCNLSVITWWTILAQIAILIITIIGYLRRPTKQHASASATGVPATVYVHPKVSRDSRAYVTNRSRSRAMPLFFIFMLLTVHPEHAFIPSPRAHATHLRPSTQHSHAVHASHAYDRRRVRCQIKFSNIWRAEHIARI